MTLTEKTTMGMSHISQKMIVDDKQAVEFIVLSDKELNVNDWIIKSKFIDIEKGLEKSSSFDYQLKRTIKGNPDEGIASQNGKALRIIKGDDLITIGVYTQSYGETWKKSHTHQLNKILFDTYTRVVLNDEKVHELEKKNKSPEKFSLNV